MTKQAVAAAIAALGLSLTAGSASAQALMSDWTTPQMKSIITDLGGKITGEGTSDKGVPYITAQDAKGLKFAVYGGACTGSGAAARCRGAEFNLSFTMDSAAEAQAKEDQLDYVAVAISASGKDLFLVRYVILDNGISRENLKFNLSVYLHIAHEVWGKL